jgi:hypothetical protein
VYAFDLATYHVVKSGIDGNIRNANESRMKLESCGCFLELWELLLVVLLGPCV